jgi:hypothetical protein
MQSISRMACVFLLALVSLSCDTTQPLQFGEQGFTVEMRATGTQVRLMDVYTGYEDNDGNNIPDGDTFLFCVWRPKRDNGLILPGTIDERGPTSVPWYFSIEVSRLPAGATEAEMIVSEDAISEGLANLSEYDKTAVIFGNVPAVQPKTINGRTFKFTNGVIRTEAWEAVMASTSNPVSTLDPANYGAKGSGLCSTFYPGPVGIDRTAGASYPFPVTLDKGDTVIVSARRATEGPPGLGVVNPPAPGLSANFKLDGIDVAVKGTKSSDPGPGTALTFSYTTR